MLDSEHVDVARPQAVFPAQDSRTSVFSDTAEIEPANNHAVPTRPPDADVPSASVSPTGNVLMQLNRAMILQSRMAPGALQSQMPPPKPPHREARTSNHRAEPASKPSDEALPAGHRLGTPLATGPMPGPPAGTASPAGGSALAAQKAAAGSSGDGSATFDAPLDASGSSIPHGGGGASAASGTSTSRAATAGNLQRLDSSASGGSGVRSNTQSLNTPTAASGVSMPSGSAFGTPLHGLGVEATLCEMQQMALIGSGGGGCVYIGRWRGVTVAAKFIISSDDDQLTRSQREALLSRLASHPHVVQTYATSVTQLTEQLFKAKDGAAPSGGMPATDPNISHDVLAGLTSGSWVKGELQMALSEGPSATSGPGFGAPLSTIMETMQSSPASVSASASASGRGIAPHGLSSMNHTAAYESDGQLSSSSVSKARAQHAEAAGAPAHHLQKEGPGGACGSSGHSCHTSTASSGAGANLRLLHTALSGAGPPTSGGLGTGSLPTSADNPAIVDPLEDSSLHPTSSGGGSRAQNAGGDNREESAATAATAATLVRATADGAERESAGGPARPAGGQQAQAVADSFDASFVRDHLGRAKYSIHEVLQQLGAHEGQFLTMVIMEYCDGGSLLAALKEGPFHRDTTSWSSRMLLRATVRTALEIAHGMQHLHLSGLVHGDLKPGNVLLKGSNQDKRKLVAKVSDLGLAHPLGAADEMAIDDGQIGSIAYMAPEVFRGKVMKASDVYSFGVLLWQMVCGTGASPYEGAHPIAIALGVSEGKMTLRWPPGVFRPLQQLGELCTQTDPAARPSFKSVVGALEKLERHMQRLAAVAAAGGAAGGGGGSVTSTPPGSSQSAVS